MNRYDPIVYGDEALVDDGPYVKYEDHKQCIDSIIADRDQLVDSLRKGIKDRDRKVESQRQEMQRLLSFLERRCVGVDQSADAARWELIKQSGEKNA
jgi:hypothetical protein